MCYAIPGKVVRLKGNVATVDYFGERRTVLNDLEDVQIGDYVYAQGGILIQKVPERDAISILKRWKGKFFRLKELDLKISKISKVRERKDVKDNKFIKIIRKAEKGALLKREELVRLLKTDDEKELSLLFRTANKLRQKYLKNSCCVHGIIEFSNYCRNDCFYCGIRKSNKKLERYRMSVDEIVEVADFAVNRLGFKALVLQSGEDVWYTTEKLVEIIRKIKERCGVLLFMSVGERSFDCYKRMYEAGARGVLFRFETSNPLLYKKLHSGPKSKFQNRIKLLRYMGELGYIIATGFLIGLPGQTEEDLVNDILMTNSLNAEMYSFGPLIPHPETPLRNTPLSKLDTVLKVLAVSRLVDPKAKILVTTALETLDRNNGRRLGLLSGANSLMINVTPTKYKKLYSIYQNRAGSGEVEENIKKTLDLLYSLGRAPTDLGI